MRQRRKFTICVAAVAFVSDFSQFTVHLDQAKDVDCLSCQVLFEGYRSQLLTSFAPIAGNLPVGRIEQSSGGYCSGVLIGPDLVLTTAHCLFRESGGDVDPPKRFSLLTTSGEPLAKSVVAKAYAPPGFDARWFFSGNAVDGFDWALLKIEQPLGRQFGFLPVLDPGRLPTWPMGASGRIQLRQAGYRIDHASELRWSGPCEVLAFFDDHTLRHDCDTGDGDSGSPLLVTDATGRAFVLALDSTRIYDPRRGLVHIAVDCRAFYNAFMNVSRLPFAPA